MALGLSYGRIERFLIIAALFLAAMSTLMEISYYLLDHKRLLGAVRQFSLAEEANIPTWYSALLLASCALSLAVIGLTRPTEKGSYRRHWLILSLIFVYMSMDEAAVIHEMSIRPVREALDLSGAFYYAWTLPAAVLMAIFLFSYRGFLRHLPATSRNRFVLAGLIFVAGAFGTEFILSYLWDVHGDDFAYGMLNVLQETMEITGASLFLSALLRHLAAQGDQVLVEIKN
ncbi:MAG: hypothetical protein HOF11_15060 [Rhodospirillaceae bacterium]|jgi:hypothetical protein|nr:hypothetical protein [Rhodospirillaceae bacterium]MBT4491375.1 hypothetical protein [Rhodospirillaceae bacterium]